MDRPALEKIDGVTDAGMAAVWRDGEDVEALVFIEDICSCRGDEVVAGDDTSDRTC